MTSTHASSHSFGRFFSRTLTATGVVLSSFFLGIMGFVVTFTMFVTSISLLVIAIGVPLLAATLWMAQWFGHIERKRLSAAGYPVAGPVKFSPSTSTSSIWRTWLKALQKPDSWRALVYGVTMLWMGIITFTVTVVWLAVAIGGTLSYVWYRFVPDSSQDYSDVPDSLRSFVEWINGSAGQTIVGILFLVTFPFIVRWMAQIHSVWARLWLGTSRVAELEGQVESLTVRRAVAAEAEAQAMRKVERDIHDGPQQRLVRLGMDLASAQRQMEKDPEAAAKLLAEAREQTADALAELRAVSRGIAPPVLLDRGLYEALVGLASRNTVPTSLAFTMPDLNTEDSTPGQRPTYGPAAIENAAYFLIAESLTNIAKHSQAKSAYVSVGLSDDEKFMDITVQDDGIGGASMAKGHGLAGLADRIFGVEGQFGVASPAGGPTIITARLPLA